MGRDKRSCDRCLFRDRLEDRLQCALPRSPRTNRQGLSRGIGRTPHSAIAGTVENVRVNHGRPQILVAQEILDRSNIISVLDQVHGKRMPEDLGSRFANRAEIVEHTGRAVIEALRLWIGNPTSPRKLFQGSGLQDVVRVVSASLPPPPDRSLDSSSKFGCELDEL
jgi:hypothetical protein